jgi:hypothetical protein
MKITSSSHVLSHVVYFAKSLILGAALMQIRLLRYIVTLALLASTAAWAKSTNILLAGLPRATTTDAAGNIYVGGSFRGTVNFNTLKKGNDTRTAIAQSDDAFITRFNANGTYGWTQTFGGSGSDYVQSIVVSGSTVYVTGGFQGTDAGIGGVGSVQALGTGSCFVLALNADTGAPVTGFGAGGVQTFGGSVSDTAESSALTMGTGIAATVPSVSGTTVYVCGTFRCTNAGVGGVGTAATHGTLDAFVLALDGTTGAAVASFATGGVQTFGGTLEDAATAMALSGANLYVTGFFRSTDAQIGAAGLFATSGDEDCFVLALNAATGLPVAGFAAGGLQKFGGADLDEGRGIAATSTAVYVGGVFTSHNAGVGGVGTYTTVGGPDDFVLALDPNDGNAISGFARAGLWTFGGSDDDYVNSVTVMGSTVYALGDIIVAGINATSGAMQKYGSKGIQKYGGKTADGSVALATTAKSLLVTAFYTPKKGPPYYVRAWKTVKEPKVAP